MKHNKHEIEESIENNEQASNNPFRQTEDTTENKEESLKDEVVDENSQKSDEKNQEQLSDLQKKYDELNSQYIRLAADFDNFRKRQAQERESLLKYGAEETMKKLLEVLDNFDRGLKAIENLEDAQQIKDSYVLVCSQMNDVLSKLGLEVINSEGQEFDPIYHEAVMQTPTSEYPENTVITQLQKGYKLGDKVLRAALVNVATAE